MAESTDSEYKPPQNMKELANEMAEAWGDLYMYLLSLKVDADTASRIVLECINNAKMFAAEYHRLMVEGKVLPEEVLVENEFASNVAAEKIARGLKELHDKYLGKDHDR